MSTDRSTSPALVQADPPQAPPAPDRSGARPRTLVIIVPAHNEAGRIEVALASLLRLRGPLSALGCTTRVYVVDDGSRDGTGERARATGADRVLSHRVNEGLGAAVRRGLLAARADGADIVVKFDADLQHDAADIPSLIEPILADEADVVYGDRSERISYPMPLVRRLGNAAFTATLRWLTGWPLRDSQPGIFAVSRTYLQGFFLPGDYNYTQQLLLDAFHKGARFAHVPVAFRPRGGGRSFISLRYPFMVLPQIVMVLVGVKPMKIFAPVGLTFMGVAAFVFCWQFTEWLLGWSVKPVVSVNLVLGTGLFGLQTLFFGILAELINRRTR